MIEAEFVGGPADGIRRTFPVDAPLPRLELEVAPPVAPDGEVPLVVERAVYLRRGLEGPVWFYDYQSGVEE